MAARGAGLRLGAAAASQRRGRRDFGRGLAEGALEFVERHFAGTQLALQHLLHQRALRVVAGCTGGAATTGAAAAACAAAARRRHCRHAALDHLVQLDDQILVGAFGLGFGRFQARQNFLDAVDGGQDQRHRLGGDRHAVAEFAHQRLAGMGQRFQPRQSEEAAGALDGVHQAEDVIQNLGVVRVLLEPHQLIVDRVQALAGLGQKLPQQIIHETGLRTHAARDSTRLSEFGQLLCKAFNIG